MIDGKKISHQPTIKYFNTLMMCRMMNCRPSQLRREDAREIDIISYGMSLLVAKNPMALFS